MFKRGIDNLKKYGSANPLSKNILLYSFGSLGSRAINFAIYPILTFYLLKEDLGFYDVVVNTIFLVIPLATLQYADGIYRVILPLDDEVRKKGIIAGGFNFITMSSLVILAILVAAISWIFPLRFGGLIFLMAFFFGINQSTKQIVRGLKKNVQYVAGDILYSLVFILILALTLIVLKLGLKGVFIAFIVANLLSFTYLIFSSGMRRYLDFKQMPQVVELKPILNYSTPLIPNTLSWWLVGSANTYIIIAILGLEFNGIYAVAYKISSVIYLLNRVFNLAWQDQLIASDQEESLYNSKIFNRLTLTLLTLAIVLTIVMKPLLHLVVEETYFIVWKYVPFLILAAVLSSISAYFGAFYLKWQTTRKIFISTLIGAFIAIICSIVLTKNFGLIGTSTSMAIGFGTVFLYRYLDTKARLKLHLSIYIPFLLLLFVFAIILSYYI
ncbi:lipopolysaccharide biosynthesis protein [Robiginitalea aurantiaca]|uniref:Oligosaccharide flippase family protein n=1 Tax=Robiginitalea aurantiaca TaxID=3056915 RepID=A0ABT7WAF5_9FLAO|nr:oligosaccharide flippase family protein [Robiginitalea aurantiaca]MDM9629897.1 oligosaccharide flippase family protein [Robiginitalea aurantiaca]